MMCAKEKRRIFFDIDGCLAVWKQASHYELLRRGYFRSLPPLHNVVKAARMLIRNHGENIEVWSLSAFPPEAPHAVSEKFYWLDAFVPELSPQRRLFCPCGVDKRSVVPGGIRPTDVLVDDYTVNLLPWNVSARGVKLLNGVNGTKGRWSGPAVSFDTAPDILENQIYQFVMEGAG